MKNVLVIGGAGYLGGATSDILMIDGNYHIRVYDNLLYEETYRKPVDFFFGDVRDTENLRLHLDWADVVVWLAAIVGDPACAINPQASVAINQETIKWLAENYDGRIVFSSSCSVYGSSESYLEETSATKPISIYAFTKLYAESYLMSKNAVTLRLGTLHGVGDLYSRVRLDLVVNAFTYHAHNSGTVTINGGSQYRPFLSVRDAARAMVQCIDENVPPGIYNLHKENLRIIDLAYKLPNHFPNVHIIESERKPDDIRNYRVSSEKAEQAFGFNPEDGVDSSIVEIRELLTNRRLKDGSGPRYNNFRFLSSNGTLVT